MLAGLGYLTPPETHSGSEGRLQLEEGWSSWLGQRGQEMEVGAGPGGLGEVGEGEKSVYCPVGGWVGEGEYPGQRSGGRESMSEVPGGMCGAPRAMGEGPGKSP